MGLKKLFIIVFVSGWSALGLSQTADRKIIIEDGQHYSVTIDERFQIGTLHVGAMEDTLFRGEQLALPAGRSLLYPDKPLSWDLDDQFVYAVSFLDHPLNDRNEAIKRIFRDQLTPWTTETRPEAVIMHSVDHNMYAYNEPYQFALSQSVYMDSFYFDAIAHNGSYWMVIVHNGEWHSWNFVDGTWKHSNVFRADETGYFSLFSVNGKLKLIAKNGSVYEVSLDGIRLEKQGKVNTQLEEGILIEDRDRKKIMLLESVHLDKEKSFSAVVNEFATTIYE